MKKIITEGFFSTKLQKTFNVGLQDLNEEELAEYDRYLNNLTDEKLEKIVQYSLSFPEKLEKIEKPKKKKKKKKRNQILDDDLQSQLDKLERV